MATRIIAWSLRSSTQCTLACYLKRLPLTDMTPMVRAYLVLACDMPVWVLGWMMARPIVSAGSSSFLDRGRAAASRTKPRIREMDDANNTFTDLRRYGNSR